MATRGDRTNPNRRGRVAEGSMAFRLRLTSVSGFPRSWLNIRWPCDTDHLRPRRTGRADLPHPALPDPLGPRHARVAPLGRAPSPHLRREVLSRSGGFPKRSSSASDEGMSPVGALRSTGVTPLRRYYDPLRLLSGPHDGYSFPPRVARDAGLPPPGQVSQVPVRSVDARCPQPPRKVR